MAAHDWSAQHRTDLITTLVPSTAVTGLALATNMQYGDTAAALELVAAVASGSVCLASFSKSWSDALSWGAAAATLALGQATATTFAGAAWPTAYAWVAASAAALGARLVYRHRTRHDDHARELAKLTLSAKHTALETARLRQQMALHQLINATGNAEPAINLKGLTPEETAIREVVHELYKRELPGAAVERSATGWTAVLDLPTGLDPDKVIREWPRVAAGLALPGEFDLAKGALSSQVVARYLDGDPLAALVEYTATGAEAFTDPVVLGVDKFGATADVELAYNHTLIAGSSKFGKSNITKLIALRLAALPDTVLYGVDMKPGAPELSLLRPILHDLATNPEQAHAMFGWLTEEMEERGAILKEAGDTRWDPRSHGRPAVFVIVDELAELVRQGDNVAKGETKISTRVESLLALARAYGIHLILATQQPSNRVFGKTTDPRGNLTVRISVRMNDRGHGQFVFSSSKWVPGDLDAPGKFLMQSPDHNRPAQYKAQFVSDEVAASEVARLGRELVPAPTGKRLILPAQDGLNNQESVRDRLKHYGLMTRRELEAGTGLTDKQVLRACQEMADVERDEETNTWRLAVLPGAPWGVRAVAATE
ncbi:FtsK/SpoIIIE domain-containing protein [Actinacidiphila rubida]|uniref:FtsK/SpoIIIE family protein n=1 Tax=Actinacidiphila rubida TaxID=310780 RepID=A0A1H8L998_9ACTN|nr:FtsK/SpoIIIE domain-containing protein [Actinacidiphila rubida]SEO01671.1 FtsK/SpoIIIE family protein [Actinacidiphila rubida]